jgi:hypothetical protein
MRSRNHATITGIGALMVMEVSAENHVLFALATIEKSH